MNRAAGLSGRRAVILALTAVLAAVAVLVAVSGGFRATVGGFRISARSPLPIAIGALVCGAAWLLLAKRARAIDADLESAWRFFNHRLALVVAIALISAVMAGAFATRSAADADASGYVSEAHVLSDWKLFTADDLQPALNSPDGWLTTPLGWRPGTAGLQVPTYPPGLPFLMAIPHKIAGINGASFVVTASAGIAVAATALLAGHIGGSIAAVIAASLLAFTPVFIHHSIQPMSDVPVTAAWMVCFCLLARRGASLDAPAGIACAIAVLIRPNLAPLAIVPLFLAHKRIKFSIPVVIAGVVLATLQYLWYGSPFRSGYGSTEELFALANIAPNVSRYFNWLITTSPILLVSVIGFFKLLRERTTQALFAFVVLVLVSYLVYAVFDDWSYLRFLLPALAILAVFTAVALAASIERAPMSARAPVLFALLLAVAGYGVSTARSHDTFKLADQLRRVSQVADYINTDLPTGAVIVSGEQSGSMRYYTHRSILRWEAATSDTLGDAISKLEQSSRPVYIVLDAWEDGLYRAKFASLAAGALDWPPILDAGTSHRTRLWKVSDRDRFLRGESLNTIRQP